MTNSREHAPYLSASAVVFHYEEALLLLFIMKIMQRTAQTHSLTHTHEKKIKIKIKYDKTLEHH